MSICKLQGSDFRISHQPSLLLLQMFLSHSPHSGVGRSESGHELFIWNCQARVGRRRIVGPALGDADCVVVHRMLCVHLLLSLSRKHQDSKKEEEKKKPHIKKPLNAFMLYMKEMRAKVVAECTLKESAAINQILGRRVGGPDSDGCPFAPCSVECCPQPCHLESWYGLHWSRPLCFRTAFRIATSLIFLLQAQRGQKGREDRHVSSGRYR